MVNKRLSVIEKKKVLQENLRNQSLVDYSKEKEELIVKLRELESKREKLVVQLPTMMMAAKFAQVFYLDVRKSPIALVALTEPEEIGDPYQYEPRFIIHKKVITTREKTNKWNGSFYEQFRYDFIQDKDSLPNKLIDDIKFNLLLRLVDNFCYAEHGRYFMKDAALPSAPIFRLSAKRSHTFNFAAVVVKDSFLTAFILALTESVFGVFENSSTFSPTTTKEKPGEGHIAVSLSDSCDFKIELEYTAKGSTKLIKIIDVWDFHSYFSQPDAFNDFSNFIRIDSKATLSVKIKASKSHLLNDQQYEVKLFFQIFPPEIDESIIRPNDVTLGFVLFQDEAIQLIDVPPEVKYKQVRARLKLFKALCQ